MPNPGKYSIKKNYMSDCMRATKSEGKSHTQGIAQCLNTWRDKHKGKDASSVDYSKYLFNTPKEGGEYYTLWIPKDITPPKVGDNLILKGASVIVQAAYTPEDMYKGKGAPTARSMEATGIGWNVNCLPEGHEWLRKSFDYKDRLNKLSLRRGEGIITCASCNKDFNYSAMPEICMGSVKCPNCNAAVSQDGSVGGVQKDASSVIDRIAGSLQKTLEEADKSDKPSVFLGGKTKDNDWREELKKEFKDKLFLIDPYDPDWDPEENIYEELALIINADYSIFYDGGPGSDKEMKFLDNTDRDYEEFEDLQDLKDYLNKLAEPVSKKACVSEILRKAARILESKEKYGFLGIKVPDSIAKKIQVIGKEIPDIELYKESGDIGSRSSTGLELESHITLIYGLTFKDPECLKDFFKDVKPFVVSLNKTSMFYIDNHNCDVLKIGVNSPDLQDIYEELRLKYNPRKQHGSYQPHCTVAYLKKGYVEKYLDKDFSEYSFTVNDVFFSYDKKKTTIKLSGR